MNCTAEMVDLSCFLLLSLTLNVNYLKKLCNLFPLMKKKSLLSRNTLNTGIGVLGVEFTELCVWHACACFTIKLTPSALVSSFQQVTSNLLKASWVDSFSFILWSSELDLHQSLQCCSALSTTLRVAASENRILMAIHHQLSPKLLGWVVWN